MKTVTIYRGRRKDIEVIVIGRRCQCINYIESLESKKMRRLKAIMAHLADEGRISTPDLSRYLRNGIYELKVYSARIFYFIDGNSIICTHGADKAKSKRLQVEIEKAERLRQEYRETKRDAESGA